MATPKQVNQPQRANARYQRVVVKAGTNVLTSQANTLDRETMASLSGQIANLRLEGIDAILVTSGAIAAGREVVKKAQDSKSVGASQMLAPTIFPSISARRMASPHNLVGEAWLPILATSQPWAAGLCTP